MPPDLSFPQDAKLPQMMPVHTQAQVLRPQTDEQTEHKTLLTGCNRSESKPKRSPKGIMETSPTEHDNQHKSLNKAVKHEQNEEKHGMKLCTYVTKRGK